MSARAPSRAFTPLVTRRNFQAKLQTEISDGIENSWLKVELIVINIHNYENVLSNLKSKPVFRLLFLALMKTRKFCVCSIFCNQLTNQNLANVKMLKKLFAM